ncbi:MAG: L-serine ammonia-lyase [Cyclobacteriaceae bacterium]|nr:L-serine ammonia-lyase [Cyclobacteriaceae bacterium]
MERISVFDIFKVGIGPSSSHTMGPWKAALRFIKEYATSSGLENIGEIQVHLYGSLAKTGKGHGTDKALILGLSGEDPKTIEPEKIHQVCGAVQRNKLICIQPGLSLSFDPDSSIIFHNNERLPFHANGMRFALRTKTGETFEEVFYSVGGGFVIRQGEENDINGTHLKYPIDTAKDLILWCKKTGLKISEVVFENEKAWRTGEEITAELALIWSEMLECTYRGCHTEGILPGGLNVKRRASYQNQKLIASGPYKNSHEWLEHIKSADHSFKETLNWVSCFALAVNEENAAFGRVVTAPTNGAAGVIPAVMLYYYCFCDNSGMADLYDFLLVAGELGSIFKKGSTISAAMGGCQAEIGVSSAMAAGALTQLLGGNFEKVLMAAEIAMEHHLGLTCDPVGGLVQIPCIERNAMGAMKAITAAYIALASDPHYAKVSLDDVIRTMWNTARDMSDKYKETSEGGLAANIAVNLTEC